MKKIFSIIIFSALLITIFFTGNSFAVSLDSLKLETDKTTVKPGENVKLTIEFGENLGAYTFDIAYDNNIFEYVSNEGGTANDLSNKVRVVYYSATGGADTRSEMSIVFKAKENITTSNPTEFSITAEGLANGDGSVTYDDITVPIVKNVTVEPEYKDYELNLKYTGTIIKNEEKEMTLSYSSSMGRYYEHARLIAEAKTPEGANVKILAIDEDELEHDIIQSGWGDAQGYKIGGKDISQVLQIRGIFSEAGDYAITFKLIDRDSSDAVIAEKTFNIKVLEENTVEDDEIEEENKTEQEKNEVNQIQNQETPTELPKTGNNIYIPIIAIVAILISLYFIYKQKNKK